MRLVLEVGRKYPELTGAASDAFVEELQRTRQQPFDELVLDFTGADTIGSMALGTLFAAHQELRKQGRALRVVGASERVQRLMRMVDMAHLLDPVAY